MRGNLRKASTNPSQSDWGSCSWQGFQKKYDELLEILKSLPNRQFHVISSYKHDEVHYLVLFRDEMHIDGSIRKWEFEIRRQDQFGVRGGRVGHVFGQHSYETVQCGQEYFRRYAFSLVIGDFVITTPGCGFGSILLEHLIQYAKRCNARTIRGRLSSVDEKPENRDRRDHFYRKFGFVFEDNGKICLNLYQNR